MMREAVGLAGRLVAIESDGTLPGEMGGHVVAGKDLKRLSHGSVARLALDGFLRRGVSRVHSDRAIRDEQGSLLISLTPFGAVRLSIDQNTDCQPVSRCVVLAIGVAHCNQDSSLRTARNCRHQSYPHAHMCRTGAPPRGVRPGRPDHLRFGWADVRADVSDGPITYPVTPQWG
jgi:hypothetical protein